MGCIFLRSLNEKFRFLLLFPYTCRREIISMQTPVGISLRSRLVHETSVWGSHRRAQIHYRWKGLQMEFHMHFQRFPIPFAIPFAGVSSGVLSHPVCVQSWERMLGQTQNLRLFRIARISRLLRDLELQGSPVVSKSSHAPPLLVLLCLCKHGATYV